MSSLRNLICIGTPLPMSLSRQLTRKHVIHYTMTFEAAKEAIRRHRFEIAIIRSGKDLTLELIDLLVSANLAEVIALFELESELMEDLREAIPKLRTAKLEELEEVLAPAPHSASWKSVLIGRSKPFEELKAKIELIAPRHCTVLIQGETGSGKELVARALHEAGERAQRTMVSINCAALPAALLESELFGHTKGSFTGAVTQRIGLFEQASGGTLFLDEIGEMPLELQGKLLRALQEREFFRLGSSTPIKMTARIVAATNVDLHRAVQEGKFRADLFYRLNVITLTIPPLRERRSDIPILAEHLLQKTCAREAIPVKTITDRMMEQLCSREWPGNVRELEHVIESAVMLSGTRTFLTAMDLPPSPEDRASPLELPESGCDFEALMVMIQKKLLMQALQRSGGNQAMAAHMLGMKRTTLISKVRALNHRA